MATLLDAEDIDLSYAPKLREHVATVPVEQEAILYEEGEGTLHQLNSTAAAVCSLFDGQAPLTALVDDLAAVFEGNRAVIEADVLSIARDLGRKGLLEGVRGDGEEPVADFTEQGAVDGGQGAPAGPVPDAHR